MREHRRILLVDDDIDLCDTLADILSVSGYAVACAHDGREALLELRSHARPALILLDIMMPVMDGWQFRAEQLADPAVAQIPVVVLTAAHHLERPIDADALVYKPFETRELLGIISSIIDSKGRQAG